MNAANCLSTFSFSCWINQSSSAFLYFLCSSCRFIAQFFNPSPETPNQKHFFECSLKNALQESKVASNCLLAVLVLIQTNKTLAFTKTECWFMLNSWTTSPIRSIHKKLLPIQSASTHIVARSYCIPSTADFVCIGWISWCFSQPISPASGVLSERLYINYFPNLLSSANSLSPCCG